ncbi:porphobilinogen synthase [Nonomuraea sp. NPDC003707]
MTTPPPLVRPRRLRRTSALREMVAETRVHPVNLILPMFVREGISEPRPIGSMVGVWQHTRDSLRKAALEAAEAGVGGIMLFGVPAVKDARGSAADAPDGITQVALRDVVSEVGEDLVVIGDVNLSEATDNGEVGVLADDGDVANDLTLERYASVALAQAEAGAHMVAPSGMMDGQVAAIRSALDDAGWQQVSILAYSAKYASNFYGPFREAVESSLNGGNRATHQQDPAGSAREALREVRLDIAEGADAVMIKPALPYLDIIRQVRDAVDVPVAAYQTSGEYAMVEAAAMHGWVKRQPTIHETLTRICGAGADFVVTYWATEVAGWLRA